MNIYSAIIARPGPNLVDIHPAMTPVSQKCQLDAGSREDLFSMGLGHIHQTTIEPDMACHHIDSAIYARPGPYLDDIHLIMPEVSQQRRLETRSRPDLLAMACPTGRRPRDQKRRRWRDYISRLAWERHGVPPGKLEEVAGEREIWASLLRLLPPWLNQTHHYAGVNRGWSPNKDCIRMVFEVDTKLPPTSIQCQRITSLCLFIREHHSPSLDRELVRLAAFAAPVRLWHQSRAPVGAPQDGALQCAVVYIITLESKYHYHSTV
ncbi:olfactory receptor [Sarotherodon galilaeus]